MDKSTRNAIERATQRARKLLEGDFAAQLEGDFDVYSDGTMAAKGGSHLSARQAFQRERVVASIEHKRSAGMSAADSVADYLRDSAFTTLNRFVALKMLEARELVKECITNGEQSAGYREFYGMAPGLPLLPDSAGYRLYIESLFDELSTEVKVLFDRRDPSSVLWPKRTTFERLLEILNNAELAQVWGEDETIGWVYQFFNGQDERRQMREESQAPRNSRELAVRNQFFTPRYVVRFLTDNTLGRIWYEMRGTKTVLADRCEYMVRKPNEEFAPRAKKDPRELRVLDPACGSGHFLLYAFDLLLTIYEEAHTDPEQPKSNATGRTLAEDYPSLEALRKAVPVLILAHNLHGVDIDARCAQIAQLALWMRAQKAYKEFGIGRADRIQVRRSNIIVAEPLIADNRVAEDFTRNLSDAELGAVFTAVVDLMEPAGELGILLRAERSLAGWLDRERTGNLFSPPEEQISMALEQFASDENNRANARRRLFTDDALHGFGLLTLAGYGFDAIVMNPPFGEMTPRVQAYADEHYTDGRNDIFAAFVLRAVELASRVGGRVGALTSRAFVTGRDHRQFRRSLLAQDRGRMALFADLGGGVLDGAMVETAAYVIAVSAPEDNDLIRFVDARRVDRNDLPMLLNTLPRVEWSSSRFLQLPQADFVYELDDDSLQRLSGSSRSFEPSLGRVTFGLTTKDDFRFVRLRWEISSSSAVTGVVWTPFAKGGEYAWFTGTTHLVVKQGHGADEIAAFAELRDGNIASTRRSSAYYFNAAVCFSRRSQRGFSMRRLRPNACFSDKTAVIVPRLGQSEWLYALPPVLASLEYQRLIKAQSKFGSYEIGPVKTLPVPDERVLAQKKAWEQLYEYFDEIEAVDETSETYCGLPAADWSPVRHWPEKRVVLMNALASCDLTPDPGVISQIDAWVEERETRFDFELARRSWAIGVVFGRFNSVPDRAPRPGAFASPRESLEVRGGAGPPKVLVDDFGHSDDIVAQLNIVLPELDSQELRRWVRAEFWDLHLAMYSRSRRTAPIYWQLSTASGRYSVWLYIHGFSRDTLFRVQNDYAAPKLRHEERRLDLLRSELGDRATAAHRDELSPQESFVEELRTFVEDLKRVAPLWNPNLDDGVIINFAPLWRLAPQNKSWQKELKSTWQALCDGKYDWAHLAMHLWPERVVPRCAEDRSLAVAHGLEDVFWVQGEDGKWTLRNTPTRTFEELVRERTSPAVKAALKSLLEAPVAIGNGGRGQRGGRRVAVAAERGDA